MATPKQQSLKPLRRAAAVVQPGDPCPAFTIDAAVSGRVVSPASFAGRRAVLVLHGPRTTDAAKEVSKAIRPRHKAKDVLMASIVDLHSMAGLWRKVAEATVKQSYEKLAAKVGDMDPGADPADYVVICPDWENKVGPLFGVPEPDQAPTAVVVGPDGRITHLLQGGNLGEQVAKAL